MSPKKHGAILTRHFHSATVNVWLASPLGGRDLHVTGVSAYLAFLPAETPSDAEDRAKMIEEADQRLGIHLYPPARIHLFLEGTTTPDPDVALEPDEYYRAAILYSRPDAPADWVTIQGGARGSGR